MIRESEYGVSHDLLNVCSPEAEANHKLCIGSRIRINAVQFLFNVFVCVSMSLLLLYTQLEDGDGGKRRIEN